jgi:hypothetical protein
MRVVRLNRLISFVAMALIVALAACGGSAKTTATPAASTTPTPAANRVQATQLVASASPTTIATPTPLANNLPSGTVSSTEAARATGGPTTAANAGTPTPLARTTVVSSTTAASTASSGATTRSTQPSGSATTAAAASGSAITGTAGPPTTTPVPTTEARGTVEQFLRTVLGKGDISGYLTPAFKSQASGDGYKLLNIQPPVQEFTVDSEQRDADGNGATVRATITTASGVAKRGFVMRRQGSTWLVDNIVG